MQQPRDEVIKLLGLIPHPDHGYFRETYRSGATPMASRGQTDSDGDVIPIDSITGPSQQYWQNQAKPTGHGAAVRNILTSIYFMLTAEKPYIALHANEATCMHYWQGGGRVEYVTVSPSGEVQKAVLGTNLAAGDTMQFLCPGGGYMKGARILDGAAFDAHVVEEGGSLETAFYVHYYVLVGEAVAPGFDVVGHHYITTAELKAAVSSDVFEDLSGLLRAQDDPTFDSFYD